MSSVACRTDHVTSFMVINWKCCYSHYGTVYVVKLWCSLLFVQFMACSTDRPWYCGFCWWMCCFWSLI